VQDCRPALVVQFIAHGTCQVDIAPPHTLSMLATCWSSFRLGAQRIRIDDIAPEGKVTAPWMCKTRFWSSNPEDHVQIDRQRKGSGPFAGSLP
jgi:hypothetical protein